MDSLSEVYDLLQDVLASTIDEHSIDDEFIKRLNCTAFVVRVYYKHKRWLKYVATTPQGVFIFSEGAFGVSRHRSINNVDIIISMDDPIAAFKITDKTTNDQILNALYRDAPFTDVFDDREALFTGHHDLSDVMICTHE